MSILGLDYGQKRIGVAKSDELHFMAHPSGFIPYKNDRDLITAIKDLVVEHHIKKIVVGLPLTLKGETGPQAQKVMSFVASLKEQVQCPVMTWDERLTTAQAERALLAHDVTRAKRKIKRDAMAAEIMLQSYLDFSKQKDSNEHV